MVNKVEWEVVDAPSPQASQATTHFMKALLGPWWKWKVAGAAVAIGATLVLFATLAGILLLIVSLVAVMAFGVSRLKKWLRRDRATGSSLKPW